MSSNIENSDSLVVNASETTSDSNLDTPESSPNRHIPFVNPETSDQRTSCGSGLIAQGQILSLQGGGLDVNWKKARRDSLNRLDESIMETKNTKSKMSVDSCLSEDSIAFSEWSSYSSQEMDSSEGLTCVMSELDIFRRSSSFSKRKIREIKEFYKSKLFKSGVVIGKPLKSAVCESSSEGFNLLMESRIEVAPSESRLADMISLGSDPIVSPSTSSTSKQSSGSQHSIKSNPGTSPPSQNSSGLFSQLSNLFASLLGRNHPRVTHSCSLAVCESTYEPLRRCQKALDVRKAIHN